MIVINEYENTLGSDIVEFSCPHCHKSLQWATTQMSPLLCWGCKLTIPDITKILRHESWRVKFQLESSKCKSLELN